RLVVRTLRDAGHDHRAGVVAASTGEAPGEADRPPTTADAADRPPTTVGRVRELLAEGARDEAERVAHTVESPDLRTIAYTSLVTAASGDPDEVRRLAGQAAETAVTAEGVHRRARLLAGVAEAVSETGDGDLTR